MKVKTTVPIRFGDRFVYAEVDALDFSDISATVDLCMGGAANFRAMELAGKIADDRTKGMPSAVYVITPKDVPVCKIGIATDPKARLGLFQVANWHQLSVASLLWTDVGAFEIEQLALRAAKQMGLKLRGEWIAAEPKQACELVVKAARHAGRPAYDSATWISNWAIRLSAVAEAKDRATAIGKLPPRGRKTAA